MLSPSPLAHCESGPDLLFIVARLWMATDLATRKERRIRNESAIIGKSLHFPYPYRVSELLAITGMPDSGISNVHIAQVSMLTSQTH